VLVLELTRHLDPQMVPILVAVVEATIVSRRLGASSIYSARLDSGKVMESSPTANAASIASIYALDEALAANFTQPSDAEA
jgi:H+/Cl- antiporter ClcA